MSGSYQLSNRLRKYFSMQKVVDITRFYLSKIKHEILTLRRFARSYRSLTHDSLKEFMYDTARIKTLPKRPIDLKMQSQRLHNTEQSGLQPIYREEGLQPTYKGYLPGHIFRHGQTHGVSSRNFFVSPKP